MKWRKDPKLSFNWRFLYPRSSPRLLKPYLINLGAKYQKLTASTGSSVQSKAAYFGIARVASIWPRKCGLSHIFAAVRRSHVSSFNVWPRINP